MAAPAETRLSTDGSAGPPHFASVVLYTFEENKVP
jgi:hypothetical protein